MKLKNKLAGYLEYCKFRKELDEKTLKAYRIDLKQYFNFVSCDEPDKEKIEEYITELHKKYKQKTVKRKIATLKAYYNYLEEEEIINDNPFRRIKVKFKENVTLPRIIPREEIEQLLNFMYNRLDENDNSVYKEDAVRYRLEHPEIALRKCAENLGISESALKTWMKSAKEHEGTVPTRGSGNYASDEAKEIARLQRELRDTKDALEVLKKAIGILGK